MKKIGILSLFIILFLIACQKDSIVIDRSTEIDFGNDEKMMLTEINENVFGSVNQKDSIELDVNNDGIADYEISSEIWGSQILGLHPTVRIKSLHENSFVCGSIVNDTIFFNYDTDTVYDAFQNVTKVYYLSTYTCNRISEDDVIVGVDDDEFIVRFFDPDYQISTTDIFKSGDFNLSRNWSKIMYGPIANPTNDTLYYFQDNDYFNCSSIPNYKNTYIGIMIIENSTEKLGWIKLNVEIEYRATILETAIQE